MIVLIAGMPFSATASLERVLNASGLADETLISDPESFGSISKRVLRGVDASWKRYGSDTFERMVAPFDDDLLATAVATITRACESNDGDWYVMDAQFAFTLPFWSRAFADAGREFGLLVVARHPDQVADSFGQSGTLPRQHALDLWRAHYERVAHIVGHLELPSFVTLLTEDRDLDTDETEALTQFITATTPTRARSKAAPAALDLGLNHDAETTWHQLGECANGPLLSDRFVSSADLAVMPPSTYVFGRGAEGQASNADETTMLKASNTRRPGDNHRVPATVSVDSNHPSGHIAAATVADAVQPRLAAMTSVRTSSEPDTQVEPPQASFAPLPTPTPSTTPQVFTPATTSQPSPPVGPEPSLVASAARAWKGAAVAFVLGSLAMILLGTTMVPQQVATTAVVLREPVGGLGFNVERFIADQVNIMSSRTVAGNAAQTLSVQGRDLVVSTEDILDFLVVDGDPFSNLITVSYPSESAEFSESAVNAVLDAYKDFVTESYTGDRDAVEVAFAAQLDEIDSELGNEELTSVERASRITQRADLLLRLNELEATARINSEPFALRQSDIEIVEEPGLPVPTAIALGMLAAALVAAVAYARDRVAWRRKQ